MKIPTKPHINNTRLAYLEKFNEREAWHKLVVKIISWKEGLLEGGSVKITDKVTSKEWNTYTKHLIKTNTSYTKQKVLSNLKETEDLIKQNGGFE